MHRRDRGGALHRAFIGAGKSDEIADAHDAEIAALGTTDGGLIEGGEMCAAAGLAQDPSVQHVGPHHVVDERGTGDFRRQVAPRGRLAHIAILGVRLGFGVTLDIVREVVGRDEIPVVVTGRCVVATEHAVLHRQFGWAAVQPLREPIEHACAKFGRNQAD